MPYLDAIEDRNKIEAWYDFLNCAKECAETNKEIARQLELSGDYYSNWNDTSLPFDEWWPKHANLLRSECCPYRVGLRKKQVTPT